MGNCVIQIKVTPHSTSSLVMSWAVSWAPAVALYSLLSIVPDLPAILSNCDILVAT